MSWTKLIALTAGGAFVAWFLVERRRGRIFATEAPRGVYGGRGRDGTLECYDSATDELVDASRCADAGITGF